MLQHPRQVATLVEAFLMETVGSPAAAGAASEKAEAPDAPRAEL